MVQTMTPPLVNRNRWIWRRLTLRHDGRTFLDRWGFCYDKLGGFYIHHITGPDPGLDLHDHPWAFTTIILRGGYTEVRAETVDAIQFARTTARAPEFGPVGYVAVWRSRTAHRTPLDVAHKITGVLPGTWTLVLRGPTRRVWGFYPPTGRVEWTGYDYQARRPSTWTGNP